MMPKDKPGGRHRPNGKRRVRSKQVPRGSDHDREPDDDATTELLFEERDGMAEIPDDALPNEEEAAIADVQTAHSRLGDTEKFVNWCLAQVYANPDVRARWWWRSSNGLGGETPRQAWDTNTHARRVAVVELAMSLLPPKREE
jgi:hypothetical protein